MSQCRSHGVLWTRSKTAGTFFAVAEEQNDILAANTDVAEAARTSTIVDADEFDRESLDRRWRQFCLEADRYVVESTKPLVQAFQHASL